LWQNTTPSATQSSRLQMDLALSMTNRFRSALRRADRNVYHHTTNASAAMAAIVNTPYGPSSFRRDGMGGRRSRRRPRSFRIPGVAICIRRVVDYCVHARGATDYYYSFAGRMFNISRRT